VKILALGATSLLAVILVACGSNTPMTVGGGNRGGSGSGTGGNDVSFSLLDNWQITMNSSVHPGTTGSAGGLLINNGLTNTVSGDFANIQPPCSSTAKVSGTLNQRAIKFSLDENGQSITLSGTINQNISAISGTYTASSGGCTKDDAGTWNATRIPSVTGTWSGTLTPGSSMEGPFQMLAPLTQDTLVGMVKGTATITGSPCFTSIALATPNFIAGQQLILTGQSGGANLQITGSVDLSGAWMTATYAISGGSCDGQTGSGTLTKQ
jgi:hypothetical protein